VTLLFGDGHDSGAEHKDAVWTRVCDREGVLTFQLSYSTAAAAAAYSESVPTCCSQVLAVYMRGTIARLGVYRVLVGRRITVRQQVHEQGFDARSHERPGLISVCVRVGLKYSSHPSCIQTTVARTDIDRWFLIVLLCRLSCNRRS
jgi:hypothetical protein